jgi:hypothetical protein
MMMMMIIIIIISIQPLGRFWQATGMALARCILGIS